jgi:hypothetical protein
VIFNRLLNNTLPVSILFIVFLTKWYGKSAAKVFCFWQNPNQQGAKPLQIKSSPYAMMYLSVVIWINSNQGTIKTTQYCTNLIRKISKMRERIVF